MQPNRKSMKKIFIVIGVIIAGLFISLHLYYNVLWTKAAVADWKKRALEAAYILSEQEKKSPVTKEFVDSVNAKWGVDKPCLPLGIF